jgi:putative membrane protein
MYYLLQFLVSAGVIYLIAQSGEVPGIEIIWGYTATLLFAVILGLVNLILGTVLRILTFPIRLLTLGAFSFVITLIVVKVADELVPWVTLTGIIPMIVIALASGLTSFILKLFK